jgi:hypothetical protein
LALAEGVDLKVDLTEGADNRVAIENWLRAQGLAEGFVGDFGVLFSETVKEFYNFGTQLQDSNDEVLGYATQLKSQIVTKTNLDSKS